jgi:hypothetical protein
MPYDAVPDASDGTKFLPRPSTEAGPVGRLIRVGPVTAPCALAGGANALRKAARATRNRANEPGSFDLSSVDEMHFVESTKHYSTRLASRFHKND